MGNLESKFEDCTADVQIKQLPILSTSAKVEATSSEHKVEKQDFSTRAALSCDENKCVQPKKYLEAKAIADQEYEELVASLNSQRILWEDTDFPASKDAIGDLKLPTEIQWKRPKEINADARLFKHGETRFDVDQGYLGDCWFLAVVAAATQNKCLMKRIIPTQVDIQDDQYCGVFRAFFYLFGEWKQVLVDDRLPVTKENKLIFMSSADKTEMWSALLEKAYAKFYGSYGLLEGGLMVDAMVDITGGMGEMIDLQDQTDFDKLGQRMMWYQRRCCLTCCGLLQWNPKWTIHKGLVQGHAYSVTGAALIKYMNREQYLIRLRNPWGNDVEWTGPWSDNSPEWEEVDKKTKEKLHLRFSADGEFWMSIEDFAKSFLFVHVCHLTFDTLLLDESMKNKLAVKETLLPGQWTKETAGGGPKCTDTFWKNPQFLIKFQVHGKMLSEKSAVLYISLMQKAPKRDNYPIGFHLYKVESTKSEISKECLSEKPVMESGVAKIREMVAFDYLTAGCYVLVPFTEDPGLERQFLIRVFTEEKVII